jgi:hypothetical protein
VGGPLVLEIRKSAFSKASIQLQNPAYPSMYIAFHEIFIRKAHEFLSAITISFI